MREALNLISSNHLVPADRARVELAWIPQCNYEEDFNAITD
jgi:hypothetical protein